MTDPGLAPFARGLRTFFDGDEATVLRVRRDDGLVMPLPVRHFFRPAAELTPIERLALRTCRGRVLDVGAGTGIHSLVLQEGGLRVTAVDILPAAVEIMRRRGVEDARCMDVLDLEGEAYDTVLLLGHGVGMAGDLPGLGRFLDHVRTLLTRDGRLLLDSVDVTRSDDPDHLAYHEANRRAGRYVGETRIRFELRGRRGPYLAWLHVDPDTLRDHADAAGLAFELLRQEPQGEYLAALARSD